MMRLHAHASVLLRVLMAATTSPRVHDASFAALTGTLYKCKIKEKEREREQDGKRGSLVYDNAAGTIRASLYMQLRRLARCTRGLFFPHNIL